MGSRRKLPNGDDIAIFEGVKKYIKAREEDPKLKAMLAFTVKNDHEKQYHKLLYDRFT